MILPGTYANGFAPRDGRPLYPELWTGCVGAWNPGLGVSGLTLRDQSGFKNNGTLTNGPTWAASQGRYALDFDGVDDYVDCSRGIFGGLINISIMMRVYLPSVYTNTNQVLFAQSGFGGTPRTLDFYTSSGTGLRFLFSSNGSDFIYYSATESMTLNAWNHIGITLANGVVSFYIAGKYSAPVLQGGSVVSNVINNSSDLIRIGGRGGGYSRAIISEVASWSRVLSLQEIRLLATRRGIAYEMAPRRRSSAQVTVAPLRYNLFSGSIGNTDVIGAS